MALYKLKGEGIVHKRVTPACRERTIEEIKDETVDELWRRYKDALQDESLSDADFHFFLTVDRKETLQTVLGDALNGVKK